ncbi:MAG: zinc ribbon domain-containing protein [Planctomycetota bacterium]|nr:MAG: zinc ribbon domain-containing protein [Planctomycetota bacterium]
MDQVTECPQCGAEIGAEEAFCGECGEQVAEARRPVRRARRKPRLADRYARYGHEKNIQGGRTAILAAAGIEVFLVLVLLVLLTQLSDIPIPAVQEALQTVLYIAIAIELVIVFIYVGLWFWAKSNPFAASVTALIIFGTLTLISVVLNPKIIFSVIGIILLMIKGGIFIALIFGVKSALATRGKARGGPAYERGGRRPPRGGRRPPPGRRPRLRPGGGPRRGSGGGPRRTFR